MYHERIECLRLRAGEKCSTFTEAEVLNLEAEESNCANNVVMSTQFKLML